MDGRHWKMNWRVEKACVLDVANEDRPTTIKVRLIADQLGRVSIGLCLLREGLISSLDLVDTTGADLFRLKRSVGSGSSEIAKGKVILALDMVELDRWLHFLLRTVRDGVAEVDHFDLEAPLLNEADASCDVTVAFPSSIPPTSPEEVRRRRGL
jgi:hypothetical protein